MGQPVQLLTVGLPYFIWARLGGFIYCAELTGLLPMQDYCIICQHCSPVHDLAEATCVRV